MIEHRVPEGADGMPLEKYLRRAWPMLPGHVLRELLQKRDVKRGGRRLGPKDAVGGGETLQIYLPDRWLRPEAEAVFDDGHLLAVVKPQGLPVDVDADGIGADTLLERLRALDAGARLGHRLDAQAGGLVLAARDDRTYEGLLEVFRVHALKKRYLALAQGGFPEASGVLRAWLKKNAERGRVRILHRPEPGAKPIETRYAVLEEKRGVARVELEPVTGRTHQLRAHMADFGHPLRGDDLYGDRALNRAAGGPLRLWCLSMTIEEGGPLPEYGGMTFAAPEPDWWRTQEEKGT